MAKFYGKRTSDIADADTGDLQGFRGGSLALLQDTIGDVFFAGKGNDTVCAGSGNDNIKASFGSDYFDGAAGRDTISGGGGNDWIRGGKGADVINGGTGNDTITIFDGETSDTVNGGDGTDLLDMSGLSLDGAMVDLGAGQWMTTHDSVVRSTVNVENVLGGGGDDTIFGSALANTVSGAAGHDWISGGNGADKLSGGAGNDTISIADGDTGGTQDGGDGNDWIDFNRLTLNAANVDLAGGYWSAGAGAGTALLNTENVEGTRGNDTIAGNAEDNKLHGGDGNDAFAGRGGADSIDGGAGDDTIFVDAGDVVSVEVVSGGAGNDTMLFGDFAVAATIIDARAAVVTDVETIAFSEAADVVKTVTISWPGFMDLQMADGNLGASDRLRILMGTATAIDLSALAFTDWNTGGSEKDSLSIIGDGDGELIGGSSRRDVIWGNGGNDTIHGGGARDALHGGAGNNIYYVDARGEAIEKNGEGIDTVRSTVSYVLGANIEKLQLLGTGNLKGTGNALANVITGNSGNNVLAGKLGADTMRGGNGNDVYIVEKGDKLVEKAGQGYDVERASTSMTLAANLEKLVLTGTANLNGTGNALNNMIVGNSGANTLNGRGGSDTLTGGAGADKFVFNTVLGANNVDTVKGFEVNIDHLRLASAIFTGLATGHLTPSMFHIGSAASDGDDHIIYNANTGKLFYDADGAGGAAQVQFSKLAAHLALDAGDFFVF